MADSRATQAASYAKEHGLAGLLHDLVLDVLLHQPEGAGSLRLSASLPAVRPPDRDSTASPGLRCALASPGAGLLATPTPFAAALGAGWLSGVRSMAGGGGSARPLALSPPDARLCD